MTGSRSRGSFARDIVARNRAASVVCRLSLRLMRRGLALIRAKSSSFQEDASPARDAAFRRAASPAGPEKSHSSGLLAAPSPAAGLSSVESFIAWPGPCLFGAPRPLRG